MTHSLKDIARSLYASGMRCNCDLDNWEPTERTGHSHVCRIHKAAMSWRQEDPLPTPAGREALSHTRGREAGGSDHDR